MKKIAILLIILMASGSIYAQKSKRTSAFNHLQHGKLDKAKTAIDAAIVHESTMNDPKTWFYRGNIYLEIAMTDNEKYQDLDPECIDKALESYLKARELDVKGKFLTDILPRQMACGEQYYNKAVRAYNIKEYNDASINFFKAFEVNKNLSGDNIDTGALYNSAISAGLAENIDLAKEKYQILIEYNYNNSLMYVTLSNYYKTDGDSIKALEYIQVGRERFPEDFQILITETNLFLNAGETAKALNNLKQALKTDTTNASIYSAVGSMYDRIVNDTNKTKEEIDKAFIEAENAYGRAIEIQPDFFDAIYNLGALYFNRGVNNIQEADILPFGDEKYDKLKELGDAFMDKSLPILEKAYELQPDDYSTLFSLKQIYSRIGNKEKYKEVSERLQNQQ